MQLIYKLNEHAKRKRQLRPRCAAGVGRKWNQPERDKIIWEHGRRNLQLRAKGILSIVCPVSDSYDIKGIGIFNANVQETRRILDEDPGVMAGIFVYEAHLCRSFPGDALPK